MDQQSRAASDRRVWLYSLEVEVMSLMVLLDNSGESATFQYLDRWKERLANERQALTALVRE